jgi:class 3 adenylate cyclase
MKHPDAYNKTVRMPATIIFCDIVGFTNTVETLDGDLVALKHHLEEAMNAVTNVHKSYDLIIDKFIGDAIMSFRGGDLVDGTPGEHAYRVVRATLDGIEALTKLENPYFKKMKIGGASSEAALIGAFGTSSRISYTILGDRVNLAARLEAAVGQCGTQNLFCARTQALTRDRDDIVWRRFGKLQVQGKTEALDIYEAFSSASLPDSSWIELYADALAKYESGDFTEAKRGFEATDAAREGGDIPAQRFVSQCSRLIDEGAPQGWRPVFKTSK